MQPSRHEDMQLRRREGTKTHARFSRSTRNTRNHETTTRRFDAAPRSGGLRHRKPAGRTNVASLRLLVQPVFDACDGGLLRRPLRVEPEVFFVRSWLRGSRFVVSWFRVFVVCFASL